MEKELWDKMTQYTPLSEMVISEKIEGLKKLEENIWVIKNFVPKNILDSYNNYIQSVPEEEWWKRNKDWWVGKYLLVDTESPVANESRQLVDKVRSLFKEEIYLGAFGSIHRLTPGQGMFIHTDNPTEKRPLYDENKNQVGETGGHNNYCILAMVVYLNSFNGGNLYFPEINFEYHGEPGDIVFFPGTGRKYDHGVRPLKDGPNRYITTGFGYDPRVESLKEAKYVFEDAETGELVDIEPAEVINDPYEAMKLPPRLID